MRQDNQWIIYQERPVTAAVRGMELLMMFLGGKALLNHERIELRALGNASMKIADARLRFMLGLMSNSQPTDEEQEVAAHVVRILDYLSGGEAPDNALDEMWASVLWLDSRCQAAGVDGVGWFRELVRGVK